MQVKSFDNQSFQSRGDRSLATYNPRKNPRHNIDTIIAMDDNQVKMLAYQKTLNGVEDKKHKKISKAMFLSIPFAAGLAAALIKPAKSELLTKQISGVSARLLNGAKESALWGALLGLATGVVAAKNKIEDKSPAVNNFTSQNPLLTFVGMGAAFAGAIALGGKYLPKLINAAGKHIKPDSILNVENRIVRNADKFNNFSAIKSISKFAGELNSKKSLEPLKSVVKTALDWSPTLLLWGGVLHAYNHKNVKNREFVKNYSNMKEIQNTLAKARIRELSVENVALQEKSKAADETISKVQEAVETVIDNV